MPIWYGSNPSISNTYDATVMYIIVIPIKDLIETRYYRLGFSYTVLGLLTVCQLWMINSFNYSICSFKMLS